jgi:hypothetical protein
MRATFAFDSLRQFENLRILRTLAKKRESWQFGHNFRARESNKQRKETLVGSTRWPQPPKFLEFVPRGELKEFISLGQGTSTGDGRLMERGRCPAWDS